MGQNEFDDLARRFAKSYRLSAEGYRLYWEALLDYIKLPEWREKHGITAESLKRAGQILMEMAKSFEVMAEKMENVKTYDEIMEVIKEYDAWVRLKRVG